MLRDTWSSRAIFFIDQPCTWKARRTRAIVSTPIGEALEVRPQGSVRFRSRGRGVQGNRVRVDRYTVPLGEIDLLRFGTRD